MAQLWPRGPHLAALEDPESAQIELFNQHSSQIHPEFIAVRYLCRSPDASRRRRRAERRSNIQGVEDRFAAFGKLTGFDPLHPQ